MEVEARFYYSVNSEDKINEKLKSIPELIFDDTYYEKTDQYNHPMKEFDFYDKKIDGRFRVRKRENEKSSSCMITWKRRINDIKESIHKEEEVEVSINSNEYSNLIFLLENVLHLELVESYERYRTVYYNNEIEIVVDKYPFGIAIEVENKSSDKTSTEVVEKWVNKIGLNIEDAYKLSWDDKYFELCKMQNKKVENIVTFDKDMPEIYDLFQ